MPGNIWLILPRRAAKEAATAVRSGISKDLETGLRNSEKQSAAKTYMIGRRCSFEVSRAHAAASAGLASARLLANRRVCDGTNWPLRAMDSRRRICNAYRRFSSQ